MGKGLGGLAICGSFLRTESIASRELSGERRVQFLLFAKLRGRPVFRA